MKRCSSPAVCTKSSGSLLRPSSHTIVTPPHYKASSALAFKQYNGPLTEASALGEHLPGLTRQRGRRHVGTMMLDAGKTAVFERSFQYSPGFFLESSCLPPSSVSHAALEPSRVTRKRPNSFAVFFAARPNNEVRRGRSVQAKPLQQDGEQQEPRSNYFSQKRL